MPHRLSPPTDTFALQHATDVLKNAKHIFLLTGAGISAESGIPTFRDKQTGLWTQFNAEELANIQGFLNNPELVWQWYQWRRALIKDKKPNPAHLALAQWQQAASHLGQQLTLVSQNVDNLHEQAGSDVHKLHGSIWHNHCLDCNQAYTQSVAGVQTIITCPSCGGMVRPSVIWFGESLPSKPWQIAATAASHADVFLSIGTASTVYPAAGLASLAKNQGAVVIEINPNPTHAAVVDIQLNQKAGEVLPALVADLLKTLS